VFILAINSYIMTLINFVLVSNYQINAHFLYSITIYEGWNFNSGNYLFTNDKK